MNRGIMYRVIALMLGVVMWLSLICVINADSFNPIITISDIDTKNPDSRNIKNALAEINTEIVNVTQVFKNKKTNFLKFEDNTSTDETISVTVNMDEYNKLGAELKQDIMEIALSNIQNSDISATNRNKLYNFISKEDETTSSLVRQLSDDVNADFASAYSTFKPFSGWVGWILGLFTLVIFMLLAVTIVIDIAYITVPGFQILLSSSTKEQKPKFVSREADYAVKEADTKTTGNSYTSPLSVYFQAKSKQLVVLAICILYLVSGQIYTLVAWFIDSFSGLLPD